MTGRLHPSAASPSEPSAFAGWEARIYPGLQLASVPAEVRQEMARALGAVGVEAEHLLRLLADFPGATGPSREAGEALLERLDAFAGRMIPLSEELEVATQAYVTAIADEAISASETQPAPRAAGEVESWVDSWWPPFPGWAPGGEPLALRLRRCGFSYRQLVAVRLPDILDALCDRMALVLHALGTLPPAGILPSHVLVQGLVELADTVQGDVVPHLLRDLGPEYPGLPTAIARLRRLAATEDSSLAGDLAWARKQYAAAAGVKSASSGGFGRLFGSGSRRRGPDSAASARWAEQAAGEWRALIAELEAMQTAQRGRPSPRSGSRR